MIRRLATPETIDVPSGTLTAPHEAVVTEHYAHRRRAVVTRLFGVLDADGLFVSLGTEVHEIVDDDINYTALLAADGVGKQEGVMRSDDFEAMFATIKAREAGA